MRTESELRALVTLLADEAEHIASVAWNVLLQEGAVAIPYLQEATRSPDPRLRGRARFMLEELRLSELQRQWRAFCYMPDDDLDLEQGCLLLSRLTGPVDDLAVRRFLDAAAELVSEQVPVIGGMAALGEILFDNLAFRGGEFSEPDNHYLSTVLERRTGIPIALVTVYVLVGRRAGLPVSGVAVPGHYLARYDRCDGVYFVDCYNRGRIYRYETLAGMLAGRGLAEPLQYLAPCSHRFTFYRMLNNLERVYSGLNDGRMADLVRRFRADLYRNGPEQ